MDDTEAVVVALMRERRGAPTLTRRRAADLLLAATLEGDERIDVAALLAREEQEPDGALIDEVTDLAAGLGLLDDGT